MGPLFDDPPTVYRTRLAARLRQLAGDGIHIGTSSWKYEGWLGSIYDRDRYLLRGRFSKKRFEETCLTEYAETFPTVCGDFSFYQFLAPAFWEKLFQTTPPSLHFSLKVPEEITVRTFPTHPRYGARGGQENPHFLDCALLDSLFLEPLRPFAERLDAIIFEFGTFPKKAFTNVSHFSEVLDAFLGTLPQGFRYAVEIRNAEYLEPEYLQVLKSRGVAHVLNAWTRMPDIPTQLQLPGIFTANFAVVRALLRRGRSYEDAVKSFSPYNKIQDPNPETRQALQGLVSRREGRDGPIFIYVNNRLEGFAPETIQAITD